MPASPVKLARVLHEDSQLMTVEIVKDDERKLKLEEGDRFYTIVFTDGLPWVGK